MSCDDITNLVLPYIRELPPYQTGKNLTEIQREYNIKKFVKLLSNENPLGPSSKAKQVIQQCADEIHLYPSIPATELKERLAEHLNVEPHQISLGNGSGEVLTQLGKTFFAPRKEVLFSQYSFALYTIIIQMMNAKPIIVPTKDWQQDLDSMLDNIHEDTCAIIIGNPNNPTGTLIPKDQMKRFIEKVPSNIIIIMDEAYHEYAVVDPNYETALSWQAEHPNVIVTRTFSKAYGLAGLRVGYCITPPSIADILNRVREPFNVNRLGQAAAIASLGDTEYLKKTLAYNQQGMQQITDRLIKLGMDYIPSHTNFITFDLGVPSQPIYEHMLRHGILIRPLFNYGLMQHLRVSIGTEEDNAIFLDTLEHAMTEQNCS